MKLQTTYLGGDDLFEGDRTVQLRSLPIGVRMCTATATLTPVKGSATGATVFQEKFIFPPGLPLALVSWSRPNGASRRFLT